MALKNEFLSNYREWDLKYWNVMFLCGPSLSGCEADNEIVAREKNPKIESVLILTISIFSIFIGRGSADGKNGSLCALYYFRMPDAREGVRKQTQMCKKLNCKRVDGRRRKKSRKTVSLAVVSFGDSPRFNGNFHHESTAKRRSIAARRLMVRQWESKWL